MREIKESISRSELDLENGEAELKKANLETNEFSLEISLNRKKY